mgnify:CR=1 FL=1
MARMQEVEASALKKPILGGSGNSGGNGNNGATSSSAMSNPPPPILGGDITELGVGGSLSEDASRNNRRTNWRLLGLGMRF